MDLSIIIVNWNTRELLAQCLRSVGESVGTLERWNVETFVIDNASTDGSVDMVRSQFPQVRLIQNIDNVGFAKANNQAMLVSKGRYLLLLNSDTVVLSGALEAMVAFMATNLQVGALGCQLLNADGSIQESYADFPTLRSAWLGTDFRRHVQSCEGTEALEVDAISGACIMIRREVWENIGGMDEKYALFVEEVDWCYRMRKAGWKVCFLPKSKVIHLLGQSRKHRSWFAYLNLHRSRLLFFQKHYGAASAQVLWLGYILVSLAKAIWAFLKIPIGHVEVAKLKFTQNARLLKWLILDQDVVGKKYEVMH